VLLTWEKSFLLKNILFEKKYFSNIKIWKSITSIKLLRYCLDEYRKGRFSNPKDHYNSFEKHEEETNKVEEILKNSEKSKFKFLLKNIEKFFKMSPLMKLKKLEKKLVLNAKNSKKSNKKIREFFGNCWRYCLKIIRNCGKITKSLLNFFFLSSWWKINQKWIFFENLICFRLKILKINARVNLCSCRTL